MNITENITEQLQKLPPDIRAHEALARLLAGNKRYAEEQTLSPNRTVERRLKNLKSQSPFAVIVSCADSRVPPEVVFDVGINDLFVIRSAGNTLTDHTIASVEYAVKYLETPLVMVMGHEDCGMFVTAMKNNNQMPAHMTILMDAIQPAVDKVKGWDGDPVENAIKANIEMEVMKLRSSDPLLSEKVKENKIKVVGGYYSIESGLVEITVPCE